MKLDTYQKRAHDTAVYPTDKGLTYAIIGLGSESGEVLQELKRSIRDDDSEITEERCQKIIEEAGDCLWYLAEIATCLGTTLDHVAETNIAKLADRKRRNKIKGQGGDR